MPVKPIKPWFKSARDLVLVARNEKACENQRMVDKLDTFAERLKYLRKKSGLSLAAVAREIGVSPQAVHKWENGGKVDNDREWALAELFAADAHWLILGDDVDVDHIRPKSKTFRLMAGKHLPREAISDVYVPLLSNVQVPTWLQSFGDGEAGRAQHDGQWIACPVEHSNQTFAMTVTGVSMENLGSRISYSEGDIIFADPTAPQVPGARIVFSSSSMSLNRDVLFRQLIQEGDRRYWRTLNPQWPQAISPVDDSHRLLATVIGKWVREM